MELIKPVKTKYRFKARAEKYYGFRLGLTFDADEDAIMLTLYLGWFIMYVGWERKYEVTIC